MAEEPDRFNWHSSNQTVHGLLGYPFGIDGSRCVIYIISADDKGKGSGRRALQELRKKYSFIIAEDIGDKSNTTRGFWIKMAREGLVEVFVDGSGQVVSVPLD